MIPFHPGHFHIKKNEPGLVFFIAIIPSLPEAHFDANDEQLDFYQLKQRYD
jgi:hypothetical protein